MPKDERGRSIEEGRERENLTSQLMWALLFTGKGGSCLNCKAAKVSSGQEPGTQSGPRPVTPGLLIKVVSNFRRVFLFFSTGNPGEPQGGLSPPRIKSEE